MTDSIISIDFEKVNVCLPVTTRKAPYCKHQHVYLDQKTRLCECRECGATIDPFDFLWSWAMGTEKIENTRKRLEAESERLTKHVKELKKEERNAKARTGQIPL